ncbi:hypothetical protein GCM10007424_01540 [Flavobacterium suaedae]|uniref:Immunodominant membrane protein n=1 Tax=Flavobacterium suaedae TaxID=1767027 RepID=A0ABQ1JCU1_9FLAO|nr:hypothetical protein [Flavobacterium suaedae]GGB65311.1 hypothetical protein GCM10007424_01540 [Flavobacterium suaedae]
MAEIKIEKKKTVWPWIVLLLLVIAGVVYFLFFRENEENNTEAEENTTVVNDVMQSDIDQNQYDESGNTQIASYVDFIEENRSNMGLDHEYTNEALMKLINATQAAADDADYDIKKDMDEVKKYADKITTDPYETSHADTIKKAFDKLAVILENIQEHTNRNLASESAAVKEAASAINPDELTLDQKSEVKSFFDKASTLLEKMNQ